MLAIEKAINMETFTLPKEFVENPLFNHERRETLSTLEINDIDEPIADIVERFNKLSFCFTLQCCYGHFLYDSQQDPNNLNALTPYDPGMIRYRIAYMAFCIENSSDGKAFYKALAKIEEIDRDYIQFGSADWFWERNFNSFVLQVEPTRFRNEDQALLEWKEAVHIEKIRPIIFDKLRDLSLRK
jgi:hypothetical protein